MRPFRYDLNQIPYGYTVEGMNRFKGLDLVDRMPEELWTGIPNTIQEAVTKTIPKKKKCKKANGLSSRLYKQLREEVRQKTEEKGKDKPNWNESSRQARRDKKAFLNEERKEAEENNRMSKTRDLSKKTGNIKGLFHARMGTIKDRNGKDLRESEEIKKRCQEYTYRTKQVLMTQKTMRVWSFTLSQIS